MWEEANSYKTSITDTTFLKTRGTMSYAAIDLFTGRGFNKDYAFNQVVYLKALQRAQKHLSVVNGQLACDLKSGTEIYISEDLYLFITDLFKDWNTWLESGKYEIIKDEQGLYTVLPKKTNQSSQTNSVTLRPIPRDIPTGENISPASLSIETEHDHYPLSTTEVKITITNHSHYEYECGENTALLTITKVNGNGKHCRPILSLMIYCGFSHRSTRVTNKQLNSIHQNPPTIQGNTVSTNHSTEAPKWLMENLNYYLNVNFQQQAHSGSVTFG